MKNKNSLSVLFAVICCSGLISVSLNAQDTVVNANLRMTGSTIAGGATEVQYNIVAQQVLGL